MLHDFKKKLLETTSLTPPRLHYAGRTRHRVPDDPRPQKGNRLKKSSEQIKPPPPVDMEFDMEPPDSALKDGERGLVISIPLRISGDSLESPTGQLDPQELRFALLFWDKLDLPMSPIIGPGGSSPEEDFLRDAGLFQRTHSAGHSRGGGQLSSLAMQAHLAAYRALEAREPGRWSMARGDRSISFITEEEALPGRGLLVSLHECVPVPDKEVPLQEILEFRSMRRAELLALRTYLEDLYQHIKGAPDRPLAELKIEGLKKAIQDHLAVSLETKFPLRLAGWKAGISFDVTAGIKAGVAAYTLGLPLLPSIGTGMLTTLAPKLQVKSDIGLRGHGSQGTPFEYVSSFHRDLFRVRQS